MPDIAINQASPVTVAIQARNIPIGTIVKLHFFSESGPDLLVDSTALQGTVQMSSGNSFRHLSFRFHARVCTSQMDPIAG